MNNLRLLVFAGSIRSGSYNKLLAQHVATLAHSMAVEIDFIDLQDYPMPLYNGDWEAEHGAPETTRRLRQFMLNYDGYIIASPEYNGSLSPLLKNTLDHLSRGDHGGIDNSAYKNKPILLLSTALGQLGGLRGLSHLRTILTNLSAVVMPNQLALPNAMSLFNEQGKLNNDHWNEQLQNLLHEYVLFVDKINGHVLNKPMITLSG